MKYNKAIYIAVFVILCTFWGNTQVLPQVPQKIFYVSPSGNDNNPGTIHKTLASFQGAKEAVLAYKKDHPNTSIKVYFRAGKYYNKESVIFHARDGGTKAAPIEYAAYPNETPLIIGGKKLNLKWEVYKNGIYKANTPKGLVFESLYVNDQEQVLARYPNYDPSIRIFNGTAADCISPNKVMEWDDPKDGYFHVIHKSLWGGFHYKITGKDDKGKLSMEGGWQNNRPENGLHPELRFVENIFEELDTINEWYLDRAKNTLYYKPDNKLDIYNANIEVAYLDNFIQLKGSHENPVKYLTFSGFHFNRSTRTFMECKEVLLRSDWTIFRGGSILFEGSENCQIKNCEFSQIGSNAIFINSYNRNVLIQTCHIHDIGASAICLVGDTSAVYNPKFIPYGPPVSNEELDLTAGPKNKLYPSHCVINNNLIHDFGTIEKQVSGVEISIAAYITISQNSIYDCPRSGINISEGAFGGHIIEFNDVFNTVLETGDHGSFNSWGRDRFWMASNEKTEERVENNRATILLDILASTIIRNNRLRCDHGWDIDLDDGSSYYHIYNNLCLANGIKLREGYYRRVENNICINNSIHPHVWLKNNHDIVRGNIFGSQLYPIKINDWGEQFDYNWYISSNDLINAQSFGIDLHGYSGDPLFKDIPNGDYSVEKQSELFNMGWKNFSMTNFGVQDSDLKKIAKQPIFPKIEASNITQINTFSYFGGELKNIETDGEVSATGMHTKTGVIILKRPTLGYASFYQLIAGDVILKVNHETVENIDFFKAQNKLFATEGIVKSITIWRDQKEMVLKEHPW